MSPSLPYGGVNRLSIYALSVTLLSHGIPCENCVRTRHDRRGKTNSKRKRRDIGGWLRAPPWIRVKCPWRLPKRDWLFLCRMSMTEEDYGWVRSEIFFHRHNEWRSRVGSNSRGNFSILFFFCFSTSLTSDWTIRPFISTMKCRIVLFPSESRLIN